MVARADSGVFFAVFNASNSDDDRSIFVEYRIFNGATSNTEEAGDRGGMA